MLPIKAYVVEAYYKWIVESGFTPYLVVDATVDHIEIPTEHVRDGQIVLNMAPQAIRDPVFHKSYLSFRTQFSGVTHYIYIPMIAVLSVYAKENGEGKMFDISEEDYDHPVMQPMPRSHFDNKDGGDDGSGGSKAASHLKVVK
jgi:stringent starvation protein B